MRPLTKLETDCLEAVLSMRKGQYPRLYLQLSHLIVRSKDNTGVGAFVNFDLTEEGLQYLENGLETVLGVNKVLQLEGLAHGLGFALDIAKGRINFLELFTYGDEEWDGSYSVYRLVDI